MLIPFITFAQEQQDDAQGTLISRRSAGLSLILIDTSNGRLIWTQQRQASIASRASIVSQQAHPPFPQWKDLKARLLARNLWHEFPGRRLQ